jgi:hypothetical protein
MGRRVRAPAKNKVTLKHCPKVQKVKAAGHHKSKTKGTNNSKKPAALQKEVPKNHAFYNHAFSNSSKAKQLPIYGPSSSSHSDESEDEVEVTGVLKSPDPLATVPTVEARTSSLISRTSSDATMVNRITDSFFEEMSATVRNATKTHHEAMAQLNHAITVDLRKEVTEAIERCEKQMVAASGLAFTQSEVRMKKHVTTTIRTENKTHIKKLNLGSGIPVLTEKIAAQEKAFQEVLGLLQEVLKGNENKSSDQHFQGPLMERIGAQDGVLNDLLNGLEEARERLERIEALTEGINKRIEVLQQNCPKHGPHNPYSKDTPSSSLRSSRNGSVSGESKSSSGQPPVGAVEMPPPEARANGSFSGGSSLGSTGAHSSRGSTAESKNATQEVGRSLQAQFELMERRNPAAAEAARQWANYRAGKGPMPVNQSRKQLEQQHGRPQQGINVSAYSQTVLTQQANWLRIPPEEPDDGVGQQEQKKDDRSPKRKYAEL